MPLDFEKVAPYLKDPLVLIGFFLFLAFLFCRYLIKRGIVPTLPPTLGFRILRTILLYGFLIGLLLIGLGFGLKYEDLQEKARHDAAVLQEQIQKDQNERNDRLNRDAAARQRDLQEQQELIARLDAELSQNLAIAEQLRKNTGVFLRNFQTLSQIVRTPGIKLLNIMFPQSNLDLKLNDATASGLADQAMDNIRDSGLLSDQLERDKITAAAQAISQTIQVTLSTVRSLQDPDRTRYVFSDEIWKSNQDKLAKVVLADLTPYQTSYGKLSLIRANYDVVGNHFVEYLTSLKNFFDPTKHQITRDSLRKVLTEERYSYELLTQYGNELAEEMRQIKQLQEQLRNRPQSKRQAAISIDTMRYLSVRKFSDITC